MMYFVFSYNRGRFLENCIRSIEDCAEGSEIVIYDDGSNDPYTKQVLSELSLKHTVISSGDRVKHKHGGLYANMQEALDSINGDRLFCFLQDDMQLVRKVDGGDISYIEDYFEKNQDSGFLNPAFLKGSGRGRDERTLYYDAYKNVYFRNISDGSARIHYSDIFISTAKRLRDNGWAFRSGEPANDVEAKKRFSQKGLMFSPFIMWLPYPAAYRGGRKTVALRLSERFRRCGFYPFRYMSRTDVDRLRSRSPEILPIAEDFLQNVNSSLKMPWIYHPLQGSRLLRHLNRVELLHKKWSWLDRDVQK